jgi:hypothetical protein
MGSESRVDASVAGTIKAESDLINGAIEMVASGHSARIVVAGLRFGDELLEPSRQQAARHGIDVEPMWSTDEVGGVDLVVERRDEPVR